MYGNQFIIQLVYEFSNYRYLFLLSPFTPTVSIVLEFRSPPPNYNLFAKDDLFDLFPHPHNNNSFRHSIML